ncbi:MAG: hypothetical protein EPO06_11650 [Burkholderiaceae bacterium]|nr:MAG: hypothetical protein EPO06_11650 [Burkholderiaceae bacterium]
MSTSTTETTATDRTGITAGQCAAEAAQALDEAMSCGAHAPEHWSTALIAIADQWRQLGATIAGAPQVFNPPTADQ